MEASVRADKFPHDNGVRHGVKLLEQTSDKKGIERQKKLERRSFCHILHKFIVDHILSTCFKNISPFGYSAKIILYGR